MNEISELFHDLDDLITSIQESAPLDVPSSTLELAKAAIAKPTHPCDIDEWARTLAEDAIAVDDFDPDLERAGIECWLNSEKTQTD